MRADRLGFVKIGIASHMARRMRELRNGCPDTLTVLGVWREHGHPSADRAEQALHWKFRTDRSHGEWFRPSDRLTRFIAEHAISEDEDHRRRVRGFALRVREAERAKMRELGYYTPPEKPATTGRPRGPDGPIKRGSRKAILAAYKAARGIT